VDDAAAGHADDYRHRHGRAVQRARVRRGLGGRAGRHHRFQGKGADEVGIVAAVDAAQAANAARPSRSRGDVIVRVDPRYFRPAEVETLLGDPSKAKAQLGWEPEITLDEMIDEMMEADLLAARQAVLLKSADWS
jgi:GDPmannose 4,6-dehydratase